MVRGVSDVRPIVNCLSIHFTFSSLSIFGTCIHRTMNELLLLLLMDYIPQLVYSSVEALRYQRIFQYISMWIQYQFINALESGLLPQYATKSRIVRICVLVICGDCGVYSIIQLIIRSVCGLERVVIQTVFILASQHRNLVLRTLFGEKR